MLGGPRCTPTLGSQIEHSKNSHKFKHSWLASPDDASLLMDSKAGCVWVASQHVSLRKTLQSVRSLGPFLAFVGGLPTFENGGNRPPGDMQTSLVLPAARASKINDAVLYNWWALWRFFILFRKKVHWPFKYLKIKNKKKRSQWRIEPWSVLSFSHLTSLF